MLNLIISILAFLAALGIGLVAGWHFGKEEANRKWFEAVRKSDPRLYINTPPS